MNRNFYPELECSPVCKPFGCTHSQRRRCFLGALRPGVVVQSHLEVTYPGQTPSKTPSRRRGESVFLAWSKQTEAILSYSVRWPTCANLRPKTTHTVHRHRDHTTLLFTPVVRCQGLGRGAVSVLDSGAEGPGFKSQPRLPRRCPITVFGKLFTPIVPLFTKRQNW